MPIQLFLLTMIHTKYTFKLTVAGEQTFLKCSPSCMCIVKIVHITEIKTSKF